MVEADGIQIRFVHHKENSKFKKPTKKGGNSIDLYCKNIIDNYFRDVYTKRVNKMDMSKMFIFILDSVATYAEHPKVTENDIMNFIDVKTNELDKKILLTDKSSFLKYKNQNLNVIITKTGNTWENGKLISEDETFKSWCQSCD